MGDLQILLGFIVLSFCFVFSVEHSRGTQWVLYLQEVTLFSENIRKEHPSPSKADCSNIRNPTSTSERNYPNFNFWKKLEHNQVDKQHKAIRTVQGLRRQQIFALSQQWDSFKEQGIGYLIKYFKSWLKESLNSAILISAFKVFPNGLQQILCKWQPESEECLLDWLLE